MATPTPTSRRELLLDLWDQYARCEACHLHRYRRVSIRSSGNEQSPLVLFILDRLEPADLTRGQILQGDQRDVLDTLLSFVQRNWRDFYYTSPVACPTRYLHTIDDLVPLPKVPDIAACAPRVLKEIGYLQPHVVIACGQPAVKCALPTKTPQVLMSAGSMFPMDVVGHHVSYPIPIMITHSLHTLGRLPPTEQTRLWHETCQHIDTAIRVAERLHTLQGGPNVRSDP